MRSVLLAAVAFVAGAVVGWLAVMVGYVIYVEAFDVFDREGAMAMGAAFGLGPIAGVMLGLAAAIWTAARVRRGERGGAEAPSPPPRPRWQRVILLVVLPAIAVYYAITLAVWLIGPAYYESYWAALAASLAPLVAAVATALLGWRSLVRNGATCTPPPH